MRHLSKICVVLSLVVLLAIAVCFVLPNSVALADGNTSNAVNDFYYSKLSEDTQQYYLYLKDYYDSLTATGEYSLCVDEFLPESPTEQDCARLFEDFMVASLALENDYPMYVSKFAIGGGSVDVTSFNRKVLIKVVRYSSLTDAMVEQVEVKMQHIIDSIGEGDRYTKLRKMERYFVQNTFYDQYMDEIVNGRLEGLKAGEQDTVNNSRQFYNSSVYGMFLGNMGICGGYSYSVKALCDAMDIPCIVIGNNGHQWNLVQMEDGNWYGLDFTSGRVGWNGEESGLTAGFLNNDIFRESLAYANPQMINLNNVVYVREFPTLKSGSYKHTGSNKDFSFTWATGTYTVENKFEYTVNKDKTSCTITGYVGQQSGDLVIPGEIDGYKVTAIEDYAFYYCSGFTGKVVIPDSVEVIGYAAFAGCYRITAIEFPKELLTIEADAFLGCHGLTSVSLPSQLLTVGRYAFYDCINLKSVTFGAHIQKVESNAFSRQAVWDQWGNYQTGNIIGLKITGPSNSAISKYASSKGISFTSNGSLCTKAIDNSWEIGEYEHYLLCEHGARVSSEKHDTGVKEENAQHGDKCKKCGAIRCGFVFIKDDLEPILVNYREPTCLYDGYSGDLVCANCQKDRIQYGEIIPATNVHKAEPDEWSYNPAYHYKTCTCGEVYVKEGHYGGEATTEEAAICEMCQMAYGDPLPVVATPTPVPGQDNSKETEQTGLLDLLDSNVIIYVAIGAAVLVIIVVVIVIISKKTKKKTS